ncbi:hypothetical protein HKD37_12G033587 [Glycine soja]
MRGLMWIEEEEWIKEEKDIMDIERGFPLLEMLRLMMYSLESSESRCLSLTFHATSRLAQAITLSAPLGFFVGLLHAKCELAAKREDALDLSCAVEVVTCEEEGGVMVEPQYPRDTNDDIINGKVKVVGASALEGFLI